MLRDQVVILEGPDGAGKTYLAHRLAAHYGACIKHAGVFPGVHGHLPRLYLELLLPALLGYQPVVLDRSWLSESIYGKVCRGGSDRIGVVAQRMLERVALSCGAVVVRCLPPVEVCLEDAGGVEQYPHPEQLRDVHQLYLKLSTHLPMVTYDRTQHTLRDLRFRLKTHHLTTHLAATHSAGNLHASVVLVGESYGPVKEHDLYHQYPFVSFSRAGCSQWLTEHLERVEVSEADLLWVNADTRFLPRVVGFGPRRCVLALGEKAHRELEAHGIEHETFEHPQHTKRFRYHESCELVRRIQDALR